MDDQDRTAGDEGRASRVGLGPGHRVDDHDRVVNADGEVLGVVVDGEPRVGYPTPSRRLEFFSPTLRDWGWSELDYVVPWPLRSHVHPDEIDREKGEMLLLPNFRLPTLIHTRSANSKWLYELSHKNPVWIHPTDAERIGVETGDLVRVETEIGHMVDRAWVTEGLRPGVVAVSHHLGRWRLHGENGVNKSAAARIRLDRPDDGVWRLRIVESAGAYESFDPDTSRVWWNDVGVHQNLTHAVHPDPISGAHCWHQKALSVTRAGPDDEPGDVVVDTRKSLEVYRRWRELCRPASDHSPDGTRRPRWLKRPLAPADEAWKLRELQPAEGR